MSQISWSEKSPIKYHTIILKPYYKLLHIRHNWRQTNRREGQTKSETFKWIRNSVDHMVCISTRMRAHALRAQLVSSSPLSPVLRTNADQAKWLDTRWCLCIFGSEKSSHRDRSNALDCAIRSMFNRCAASFSLSSAIAHVCHWYQLLYDILRSEPHLTTCQRLCVRLHAITVIRHVFSALVMCLIVAHKKSWP